MAGIRKAVLITINKISSGVTSDNQISKATALQTDIDSTVASRDPIRKSKIVATGANAFYTDGVLYKFFDLSDIFQNVSDFSRVVQFFRDHLDEFTNSDVIALGTLKPFSNEFSTKDDAPIFSIDKTLENVIVSEDLFSTLLQFNRLFVNDFVLEEVLAFSLEKPLSDQFQSQDVIKIVLTLIRRVIDIVTVSDSQIISVIKGIIDIVSQEETLNFDFAKILEHLFDVQDVFEASTIKSLQEIIDTTESSTRESGKNLLDEISFFIEIVTSAVQKQLIDETSIEETLSKSVSTIYQDISSINDVIKIGSEKSEQDIFISNDVIRNDVGKNNLDVVVSFEIITSAVQKQVQDSYLVDETTTKAFVKIQQEIALTDDKLAAQPTKVLQEEVTLFDQINTLSNFNKTFEDTHQAQSEGFLVAQNYTIDNTYFLEDYVGQSATFT